MRLPSLLKRVATVLVLVAALVNGLTAPLAHGHVLMGAPAHGAPSNEAATTVADTELAQADECEDHENSQASHHPDDRYPDDRSHKSPGKMQLICSNGGACCASVAVIDLPVVVGTDRSRAWINLPSTLVGLTPPVGERPPLLLHV